RTSAGVACRYQPRAAKTPPAATRARQPATMQAGCELTRPTTIRTTASTAQIDPLTTRAETVPAPRRCVEMALRALSKTERSFRATGRPPAAGYRHDRGARSRASTPGRAVDRAAMGAKAGAVALAAGRRPSGAALSVCQSRPPEWRGEPSE